MPNRPKRQSEQHVIGRKAVKIFTAALPPWWVTREYQPDYGIDLEIELFDEVRDSHPKNRTKTYDSLGEHLFVQVKGAQALESRQVQIQARMNVERSEGVAPGIPPQNLQVFAKAIETTELVTVQRMGAALPVLLVLVDVSAERSFFVSLTDYVDKIILPEDPDYSKKETKTIFVPELNEITRSRLVPLQYYAKRPKLYAAFQKFAYQDHELRYVDDADLLETSQRFARFLLRSDVWNSCSFWLPIAMAHENLKSLLKDGNPRVFGMPPSANANEPPARTWVGPSGNESNLYTRDEVLRFMEIRTLWNQLANIGRIHEEICREWFLPLGIDTTG